MFLYVLVLIIKFDLIIICNTIIRLAKTEVASLNRWRKNYFHLSTVYTEYRFLSLDFTEFDYSQLTTEDLVILYLISTAAYNDGEDSKVMKNRTCITK